MSKPNVYIVDDDHSVRDSLQLLLAASGFAVRGFASAQEFLRDLPNLEFGCAIVDVQMPDLDGLGLQRRMAELEVFLPVVVITGRDDLFAIDRAGLVGPDGAPRLPR